MKNQLLIAGICAIGAGIAGFYVVNNSASESQDFNSHTVIKVEADSKSEENSDKAKLEDKKISQSADSNTLVKSKKERRIKVARENSETDLNEESDFVRF